MAIKRRGSEAMQTFFTALGAAALAASFRPSYWRYFNIIESGAYRQKTAEARKQVFDEARLSVCMKPMRWVVSATRNYGSGAENVGAGRGVFHTRDVRRPNV
jgi:hypothetical protein